MKITKIIFTLSAIGMLVFSCKNATDKMVDNSQKTATTTATVGKIETASFSVSGMSCEVMCATKIEKELSSMDGVQKAKVDFEQKTATIQYDSAKQTPETLIEKVEAVADGKTYKASNLKSSADKAMLFQDEATKNHCKKSGEKCCATGKCENADKKCCKADKKCKKNGEKCCATGKCENADKKCCKADKKCNKEDKKCCKKDNKKSCCKKKADHTEAPSQM